MERKRFIRVEAEHRTPRGIQETDVFYVRRLPSFQRMLGGQIGIGEVNRIQRELVRLGGSPEKLRVTTGVGKEARFKADRERHSVSLERRVDLVRGMRDINITQNTARNLHEQIKIHEDRQHKALAAAGAELDIPNWRRNFVRRAMYPRQDMHEVVASKLMSSTSSIRLFLRDISHRKLSPDKVPDKVSWLKRQYKNLMYVLGAPPFLAELSTVVDDIDSWFNLFLGKGTWRGRLFKIGASFASDLLQALNIPMATSVVLAPLTLVYAPAVNYVFNPAMVSGAKDRVDNERYLLQLSTLDTLLNENSGISQQAKKRLAQQVIQGTDGSIQAQLKKINRSADQRIAHPHNPGDKIQWMQAKEYAGWVEGIYTKAQSILNPQPGLIRT